MGRKTHGPYLIAAIEHNDHERIHEILSTKIRPRDKVKELCISNVQRLGSENTDVPLFVAARMPDPTIIEYLLKTHNVDVNHVHKEQAGRKVKAKTALIVAVRCGLYETVEAILKQNADTSFQDHKGRSALHHAVRRADYRMAKMLLSRGAQSNLVDKGENAPLHIASIFGHAELVKLLIHYNADVFQKGQLGAIPIHIAAKEGHVTLLNLFCKNDVSANIKVPCYGDREKAPIHVSAEEGHYECVNSLIIDQQADVNIRDSEGETPLHCCVLHEYDPLGMKQKDDYTETSKVLLKHNANPNLQNGRGETPLHLAARNQFHKIVHLLIVNGADPLIEDNDRNKAIELVQPGDTVSRQIIKQSMEERERQMNELLEYNARGFSTSMRTLQTGMSTTSISSFDPKYGRMDRAGSVPILSEDTYVEPVGGAMNLVNGMNIINHVSDDITGELDHHHGEGGSTTYAKIEDMVRGRDSPRGRDRKKSVDDVLLQSSKNELDISTDDSSVYGKKSGGFRLFGKKKRSKSVDVLERSTPQTTLKKGVNPPPPSPPPPLRESVLSEDTSLWGVTPRSSVSTFRGDQSDSDMSFIPGTAQQKANALMSRLKANMHQRPESGNSDVNTTVYEGLPQAKKVATPVVPPASKQAPPMMKIAAKPAQKTDAMSDSDDTFFDDESFETLSDLDDDRPKPKPKPRNLNPRQMIQTKQVRHVELAQQEAGVGGKKNKKNDPHIHNWLSEQAEILQASNQAAAMRTSPPNNQPPVAHSTPPHTRTTEATHNARSVKPITPKTGPKPQPAVPPRGARKVSETSSSDSSSDSDSDAPSSSVLQPSITTTDTGGYSEMSAMQLPTRKGYNSSLIPDNKPASPKPTVPKKPTKPNKPKAKPRVPAPRAAPPPPPTKPLPQSTSGSSDSSSESESEIGFSNTKRNTLELKPSDSTTQYMPMASPTSKVPPKGPLGTSSPGPLATSTLTPNTSTPAPVNGSSTQQPMYTAVRKGRQRKKQQQPSPEPQAVGVYDEIPHDANGDVVIREHSDDSSDETASQKRRSVTIGHEEIIPNHVKKAVDTRQMMYVTDGKPCISIVGGNADGVFVNTVAPGSNAQARGVMVGDQILRLDNQSMKGKTKEEVYNLLNSLTSTVELTVRHRQGRYKQIVDNGGSGDAFFVRAHFRHVTKAVLELNVNYNDIFSVRETMPNGKLGMWSAVKVNASPNEPQSGLIPNKHKADQIVVSEKMEANSKGLSKEERGGFLRRSMRPSRSKSADRSKGKESLDTSIDIRNVVSYERVEQKTVDFKRPVVLLGLFCDSVRDILLKENSALFETPSRPVEHQNTVQVPLIQQVVNQNKHCLIILSPKGIEYLNDKTDLCPMVLYLMPTSKAVVKSLKSRFAPDFNKKPGNMYEEAQNFEKMHGNLFSSTIHYSPSGDWFSLLKDTIKRLQHTPVWTKAPEIIDEDYDLDQSTTQQPIAIKNLNQSADAIPDAIEDVLSMHSGGRMRRSSSTSSTKDEGPVPFERGRTRGTVPLQPGGRRLDKNSPLGSSPLGAQPRSILKNKSSSSLSDALNGEDGSVSGSSSSSLPQNKPQTRPPFPELLPHDQNKGPPAQTPPMSQGQLPQGQIPQGQTYGQIPRGQMPQGQPLPGQIPQGQPPQGQIPQGQPPQGQFAPRAQYNQQPMRHPQPRQIRPMGGPRPNQQPMGPGQAPMGIGPGQAPMGMGGPNQTPMGMGGGGAAANDFLLQQFQQNFTQRPRAPGMHQQRPQGVRMGGPQGARMQGPPRGPPPQYQPPPRQQYNHGLETPL